jgi:acetoacetate decarboxylase
MISVASMGFKHHALAHDKILATLSAPNFLLKIIPHVDGTARICELVRYFCEDITIKGAWEGPASPELFHHALAPVAALPVRDFRRSHSLGPDTGTWDRYPRLSRNQSQIGAPCE